jgi:hypothetical protein
VSGPVSEIGAGLDPIAEIVGQARRLGCPTGVAMIAALSQGRDKGRGPSPGGFS